MKVNNQNKKISYKTIMLALIISTSAVFSGCGGGGSSADSNITSIDITQKNSEGRSNEPRVLVPIAAGTKIAGNETTRIDYSNSEEGYIIVTYTGASSKIKFQLTGNNQVTYTYNISPNVETVIPLSSDSGTYSMAVYENIGNDQYSTSYSDTIEINIVNTFGPFLYPNQYVNFTNETKAVSKAASIVKDASCDLEAVSLIYEYVINNVTYDKEEAETVETSYLPDVDEVLSTGKGICFDYAALMAAMLRSQRIPTRLEIGYAKDAYHAWISVYTQDQGWIGGVIQFDGSKWTLMDPTLASNSKNMAKIKEFIGDGSSYTTKYIY